MSNMMVESAKAVGDNFIWITSIIGGVSVVAVLLRYLARLSISPHEKALIGEWFGYAFFHSVDGSVFYKESIAVHRTWPFTRRLSFEAQPYPAGSSATTYKGWLESKPPIIICSTVEAIYGDRTFAIGRRAMDARHGSDVIVGLALGKSYDDSVHNATGFIWSRSQLDPNACATRLADPEIEQKAFSDLIARYIRVEAGTAELQLH